MSWQRFGMINSRSAAAESNELRSWILAHRDLDPLMPVKLIAG